LGQIGGADFDDVNGVAIDSLGNTYFGGTFRGICDMDPDPASFDQINIGSDFDVFLVKLKPDMQYEWSKRITTTLQYMGRVEVNPKNEVFVTAYTNQSEYHLVKLDGAGTTLGKVLVKAKFFAGAPELNYRFDKKGNLYTLFSDSVGAITGTRLSFYDTTGTETKFVHLLGNNMTRGFSLDIDKNEHIYITGWHRGTLDLDPDTSSFLSVGVLALEKSFFVKWSQMPDSTSSVELLPAFQDFSLSPNPVQANTQVQLQLAGTYRGVCVLQVFSSSGQQMLEARSDKQSETFQEHIHLPRLNSGTYFLVVKDEAGRILARKTITVFGE
jgi:hypothetical protein